MNDFYAIVSLTPRTIAAQRSYDAKSGGILTEAGIGGLL
jgi:hypothetical protein